MKYLSEFFVPSDSFLETFLLTSKSCILKVSSSYKKYFC